MAIAGPRVLRWQARFLVPVRSLPKSNTATGPMTLTCLLGDGDGLDSTCWLPFACIWRRWGLSTRVWAGSRKTAPAGREPDQPLRRHREVALSLRETSGSSSSINLQEPFL